MTSLPTRLQSQRFFRAMTMLALLGWSALAVSCSAEVAPEFLTLSITSDAPKSGELDTLRFLFTDGEKTWPSDPGSPEGNKELSSTSNPVSGPVIVQIDYQALDTFSTESVTLQVSGLSEGLTRTSYEGSVNLSAREVVEIRLRQLEDNCDVDGDGFLDCTIAGCCSADDMALSDCEPEDPDANPFGVEVACEPCDDVVDNDCQGGDQPCIDTDSDGVPDCEELAEASGCPTGAELDADIYPSRPELCDGKDNDCNGQTDETFLLTTVKGTPGVGEPCGGGECADGTVICVDATRVECSELGAALDDCGESGTGNGKDEDCDGLTDEGCDESDLDGDGYSADDCDPEDAAVYPGALETCCLISEVGADAMGQACSKEATDNQPCPDPFVCVSVGEGAQCLPSRCDSNCDGTAELCSTEDLDGDGHVPPNDCDDTDPMAYPSAPERCGDGIDQSCSGSDLSCEGVVDNDGDGWSPPIDCLDDDDDINPSEAELCDGIDNDCDDVIDEGNPETNDTAPCGTGEGECIQGQTICVNGGGITGEISCIGDKGPETDICNGLDDDCDGSTDEDFAAGGVASVTDLDGTLGLTLGESCGTGACSGGTVVCGPGSATLVCPTHAQASPDICNGIDDDCDGLIDEDFIAGGTVSIANTDGTGTLVKGDACGLGACQGGSVLCTPDGKGLYCDTESSESPDLCNGVDDDCDGTVDESFIAGGSVTYTTTDDQSGKVKGDACGTGECGAGEVVCAADGLTLVCDNATPTPDLCDGADNDCDGLIDEDFIAGGTVSIANTDGTGALVKGDACGLGACQGGSVLCTPDGKGLYCDTESSESPDLCNGNDDDCDGEVDEDFIAGGSVTYTTTDSQAGKVKGDACGAGACGEGQVICSKDGLTLTCDNLSPTPDVCDDIDNDCDGTTDEAFVTGGVETYTDLDGTSGLVKGDACGTGSCAGGGVVICTEGGEALTCNLAGQASPDVCDDVDNDCDGATDEAFIQGGSVTFTDLNGSAGLVKGESCGTGACASGTVVCHAGGDALTCDTASQASPDICDDTDNDCDGAVDEEFLAEGTVTYTDGDGSAGLVKGESCGTGACASGTVICHAAGDALTCDTATQSTPDVCDDIDNDCDGTTDEAFIAEGSVTFVDSDGTPDLVKGDACGTGSCGEGQVICGAEGDALICSNTLGAIERCDGLDNDCDGEVDEDFKAGGGISVSDVDGSGSLSLGEACGGVGACASGVVVCSADGSTMACESASSSSADLCDGEDNDCDGEVDEDFVGLTLVDLDGTAGLTLGDACGQGACDPTDSGVVQCNSEGSGIECSTDLNASADTCDGVDNDCDGTVDEDFIAGGTVTATNVDGSGALSKGQVCGKVGACGAGTIVCDGPSALICSTLSSVSADTCDGLDNDCDGEVDEDFIAGGTVTAKDVDGSGALTKGEACGGVGACGAGTVVCDGPSALICSTLSSVSADLCDGEDNDCDGTVDEAFIAGGTVTATDVDGSGALTKGEACGGVGACGAGTVICDGPSALVCDTSSSASADVCDGIDNDCDGVIDEDFIAGGTVTATDVDGTGALTKGQACGGIGVCGAGTVICDGPSALICSTVASASADICDGEDNDCDGESDEHFGVGGEVSFTDFDGTTGLVKGADCGGGSCGAGQVICAADGNALSCSAAGTPSSEQCDGADNDCDGEVDEDFKVGGSVTTPDVDGSGALVLGKACGGIGACAAGTVQCNGTGGLICSTASSVSSEACDDVDNDCDGEVDEDFAAGGSVTIPNVNGEGSLSLGQACGGIGACGAGSVQCSGTGGLVCSTASSISPDVCDTTDNDCDGETDEDFGAAGSITTTDVNGAGALHLAQACGDIGVCGAGTVVCDGTAGLICSTSSAIGVESCDNQDDDCDGLTDESLDLDGSSLGALADVGCTILGVCSAQAPVASCAGGSYSCDYSGVTDYEGTETLCDGKDNDCDGQIDDVNPASDSDCDTDGECADFTATCNGAGGWSCVYNDPDYSATDEADAQLCDGKDNDCDGSTDENCSDLGDSCTTGETCPGGNCVDGVCCDTACESGCGACNLAGTEGTCTPYGAGEDPEDACDEQPWINEVNHLDTNTGDFFIEVVGRTGTDTSGWRVAGVGPTGFLLSDETLPASISGPAGGYGFNAIQMTTTSTFDDAHGAVLLDGDSNVIDYVIWEAVNADSERVVFGVTPTVAPSADTEADDSSIRLSGAGSFKDNFTWQSAAASSPGSVNDGQSVEASGTNVCDGAFACVDSCADGVIDGDESDVDCGGQCGATCTTGESCVDGDDCELGACIDLVCANP